MTIAVIVQNHSCTYVLVHVSVTIVGAPGTLAAWANQEMCSITPSDTQAADDEAWGNWLQCVYHQHSNHLHLLFCHKCIKPGGVRNHWLKQPGRSQHFPCWFKQQWLCHWTASRRWMHRKAEQDECKVWQHGFVDLSQSIENQQIVHSNTWFVQAILLTHRPV